jgi:hypothetical protein
MVSIHGLPGRARPAAVPIARGFTNTTLDLIRHASFRIDPESVTTPSAPLTVNHQCDVVVASGPRITHSRRRLYSTWLFVKRFNSYVQDLTVMPKTGHRLNAGDP